MCKILKLVSHSVKRGGLEKIIIQEKCKEREVEGVILDSLSTKSNI